MYKDVAGSTPSPEISKLQARIVELKNSLESEPSGLTVHIIANEIARLTSRLWMLEGKS